MSPWVGKAMDRKSARRRRDTMLSEWDRHKWLQVGTVVDYHAILGGPITNASGARPCGAASTDDSALFRTALRASEIPTIAATCFPPAHRTMVDARETDTTYAGNASCAKRRTMCEEAFDEVIIPCEDGMVLHVTGGYGREEVCLGIGRSTEDDRKAGCAGMPALVVLLDREARTALRKALRSMMRGGL